MLPSQAVRPGQPLRLPGQTRVTADEYREFRELGHGEIFNLDADACAALAPGLELALVVANPRVCPAPSFPTKYAGSCLCRAATGAPELGGRAVAECWCPLPLACRVIGSVACSDGRARRAGSWRRPGAPLAPTPPISSIMD